MYGYYNNNIQLAFRNLPVMVTVFASFPAELDTVHSYSAPSEPVIIGNCKTGLLEIIPDPCFLHLNMLLGPLLLEQVKVTFELKVALTLIGDIVTLP